MPGKLVLAWQDIWQKVEHLAKISMPGILEPIWEVTGKYLPVLPALPGHPVSERFAGALGGERWKISSTYDSSWDVRLST